MTEESANKNQNRPRILIVDDSKAIRFYVRELLEQEYDLFEAADGVEGLEAIASYGPDLVLLDLEMPRKNGLEVLDALDPTNRLFSVVLVTTVSSLQSIVVGLERGADDYIVKPFKDDEFMARVCAALRIARGKKALFTARQHAEEAAEQLKESQQQVIARERMLSIASLAAGTAHQINNPLGFIISNFSALERYTGNLLAAVDAVAALNPEESDEILKGKKIPRIRMDLPNLIHETLGGLQRIALIVKGLSALEIGLAATRRDRFELSCLISALIPLQREKCADSVTLSWSPAPAPLFVSGFLTLLNGALEALLTNAREAADSGTIQIATAVNGSQAIVSITNPSALPPGSDTRHFLEPFFSSKSPEHHCGLGLAIAERFIAAHNGTLAITQLSNGNMQVTVTLPLSDQTT